MYKWKSAREDRPGGTRRRLRLEAWVVAATFLALITVTVGQALTFGY
jgi:hypothetical protein